MVFALLAALLPVALGVGLGLGSGFRRHFAGPASTFALAAAGTVVLVQLLPASGAALGGGALLVFVGALLLPTALERVARHVGGGANLGATVGLLGVAAHQAVDGLEVGATWGTAAGPGVAMGVAAHALPLVAAMVSPHARRGLRPALWVGALLVGATAAGVVGGQLGAHALHGVEAWLPAAVGGLMLHVLGHALNADPPRTRRDRSLELGALVAGVALPVWLLEHGGVARFAGASRLGWAEALVEVSVESAPPLLVGLAAAAVAHRFAPRVLATSPAARVFTVFALPALAWTAAPLSVHYLGVPFTAVRLGGAALAGGAGALAAGLWLRGSSPPAPPTPGPTQPRSLLAAWDALVADFLPWMGVGVLAAASLEVFVPSAPVQTLAGSGAEVPLIGSLAALVPLDPAAVTPAAGVLWAKGMSPAALLMGLWVGTLHPRALARLLARLGPSATGAATVAWTATALLLALGAGSLLPLSPPLQVEHAQDHGHGWGSALAGLALVAVLARSLWLEGPRAWLGRLLHPTTPQAELRATRSPPSPSGEGENT